MSSFIKDEYEDERRALQAKDELNYGKNGRFRRFYCMECDVQLHDHENFEKHLNGGPHLKNMQRIREIEWRRNSDGSLRTGMENDEKPSHYAERMRQFHRNRAASPVYGASNSPPKRHSRSSPVYDPSPPRSRSPKRSKRSPGHSGRSRRSPWSSTSSPSPPRRSSKRRSRSPAYSSRRSRSRSPHYRRARRSDSRSPPFAPKPPTPPPPGSKFEIPPCIRKEGKNQWKCTVCNKEARSLEILQSHLSSKDHRKRTAPVEEYRCEPCNLVVSSEETLRQHFAGMPHMRVIAVMEQNRKKKEEYSRNSYDASAGSINDELVVLRQMCQEKDKQIRNLKVQNQNLIRRIEYYEKNAKIKSESNSITDD